MFVDDLDEEEFQDFLYQIRGKSYTEILNMLNPKTYPKDTSCYILSKNEVIKKDKYKEIVMKYMKMANR